MYNKMFRADFVRPNPKDRRLVVSREDLGQFTCASRDRLAVAWRRALSMGLTDADCRVHVYQVHRKSLLGR